MSTRRSPTAFLTPMMIVLVTLMIAACSSPSPRSPSALTGPTGPSTGTGAPAGSNGSPGSARYEGTTCPFAMPSGPVTIECGQLLVRESRLGNGGGTATVHLAVARLHSKSERPAADPVMYLEGGPGGSALTGIDSWLDPVSPILRDRDVILMDQRGTGYSTPRLSCDPEMLGPGADAHETAALSARCHDRLVASGINLNAYNTAAAAADAEDLRIAMGFGAWNLFGVSYGSRVALEIMRRYPAGLRSVVLDSVYPPGVKGLDEQPLNTWAAIRAVLEGCRGDDRCNDRFANLETKLIDAIGRLNRRPITIQRPGADGNDETIEFTGDELVRVMFDALYNTRVIPDIPRAINAAATGNAQYADDLLAGAEVRKPKKGGGKSPGTIPARSDEPPSDTDGLFLSVECAEDAPQASVAGTRAASADIPAAVRDPLVADVEKQLTECRNWPVNPERLEIVRSDVPTLLLAGAYDPITPARWAREAANTLSRNRVIEVAGAGHGMIDSGTCPTGHIVAFLANPDATSGPACDQRPRFTTR